MFFAHHEARGLGGLTFRCRSLVHRSNGPVLCMGASPAKKGQEPLNPKIFTNHIVRHLSWRRLLATCPKPWLIIDLLLTKTRTTTNACILLIMRTEALADWHKWYSQMGIPGRREIPYIIYTLLTFKGAALCCTRTACFKKLHCFALWSYQRWRPICKSERINWPARLGRDGRFLDGDTKNKQTKKKKENRKGRTNQRHVLYFLFVLSCISYPGMFPRCWMGPKTLRFLSASTLLQFKCRRTLFKLVQFALFESFKLAQVRFKWLQGCSLRINTLIELSERRS